jgi:hypothetical protein
MTAFRYLRPVAALVVSSVLLFLLARRLRGGSRA